MAGGTAASSVFTELRQRPLMFACVLFLAGMAAARQVENAAGLLVAISLALMLLALLTVRRFPTLAWLALMALCVTAGATRSTIAGLPRSDDIARLAGAADATVEGTVVSVPEQRGWSRCFRLRVMAVVTYPPHSGDARGLVEVMAPLDARATVGDRVVLTRAAIELPEGPEEPGGFDYRAWLRSQGVTALVSAREVTCIGADTSLAMRLARLGMALRERVVTSVEAAMPGRDGALYARLLVGMVYGLEASPLPDEIVEEFRRAGTVHLLVVSGAQVSMIALTILALTGGRRWRALRWWQATMAAIAVGALVLIVGLESSVARAVAMFALLLVAALTRRDYDLFTALALSAAVICAAEPGALTSLSFQLTYGATLGLALFLPRDRLQRIDGSSAVEPLPALRAILWATVGAWVMTTPLLAHTFSGFALTGNLANLVNVPVSVLVMLLGFIALPIALLPPLAPLLLVLCALARWMLSLVMQVNALAGSLPLAFVSDFRLTSVGCATWYFAVAGLVSIGVLRAAQERLDRAMLRLHPMTPSVAGLAAAALLVAALVTSGRPPRAPEVTILPVGAGQCVVVRAPTGATFMADCGGGGGAPGGGDEIAEGTVIPFLARRGIDRIDALAISHWDADHFNALGGVLRSVGVDLLLLPPELADARRPRWLDGRAAGRWVMASAGATISLGGGVQVEVLGPPRPLVLGARDPANSNSVALRVGCAGAHVLLPGDLDAEGARRLIRDCRAAGQSLRAHVLVLPHHGRGLDRMADLLDAVRPTWAVASCDWHADEYLTAEALTELDARGIRLLRTDQEGTITFVATGSRLRPRLR